MNTDIDHVQRQWGTAVLNLLHREHVDARIVRAVRASAVLTYVLQLRDARQLGQVLQLDEPLALAAGVDAVRLARHRGVVHVEVTLPPSMWRPVALASVPRGTGTRATLGIDTLRHPVRLDVATPEACHVLVAGTTGSGKTTLMRSWLVQLVTQCPPSAVRVMVLDGKGDLSMFSHLPHLVCPVVTDPALFVPALAWCVAELDRRKAEPVPWRLVVVIDELAEVLTAAGGTDGPAAQSLQRLTSVGRSLGVSVVVGTQHPTSQTLGGSVARANLPGRCVGRVVDASASALACGVAGAGAHRLRGRGDFLMLAGADPVRLQIAAPGRADLDRMPYTDTVPEMAELDGITADGAIGAVDAWPASMLAFALASDAGIHTLRRELGIGGTARATRLRRYALDVAAGLREHGCGIYCDGDGETEAEVDPDA